ncbi:UNVERIFIED_CONTAM: hypothetical protein Slati_2465300 [Sesamum latifolium]|uniref:Reverse transcriptase domain-containing protein n=1 Tax=Sesamum latifolium TaxID=2727402 RepID=A0AAW2WDZ5_9LAMI
MSVIYGECDLTQRRELWAGLLSLSEDISDDAWCILARGVGAFGNVLTEYWSMKLGWGLEQGMFRFDNFLAKQPGFLNTVWRTWRHIIHGTQMYGVITKLKALKPVFRAQRKVRGDLSNNVRLAKDFLVKAQTLFDTYKEATLLQVVKLCQVTYCTAVQQESSMLQQRAKLNWLKHDYLGVYFLLSISAGGTRTNRALDLSFLRLGLKHTLTLEEADALISPVTFSEIKEAFFDISEDSAPGPDGYSSAFFKAAWPVIGDDVCAEVMEFFQSDRLLKQFNNTLLALIPKVQLPIRVSDFRPIACCNVLYKAITKILVRRLQKVLHLLIDYSQNAFIPGHSIADNVMLAQELLAGYNQNKLPPRCTIKVDIQKAYDSGSSGHGYAKVSWAQVCKPKEEGGLGIRRVLHMNQALMMKQVWRVLQEDTNSIWVAWVLLHRLNNQTIWNFKSSTASWCWKKLVKLSTSLRAGLEYKVGHGQKFKLWTDIWHPRGPLIQRFPRGPVVIGLPTDSLLKTVIQHGSWNWPSETDFDIQEIIAGLPNISPNQSDAIIWRTNGGKFTTAVAFSLLQPPSPHVLWHRLLGGKFKIPRHDFILWLAILERLSTMDRP